MATDKPLLPMSESACLSITIVGVMGDERPDSAQLLRFGADMQTVLYRHFPDFKPGYPPFSVSFITLPELRTPDAE
jgi:hypothetical protein